jgi:hypothetical protein
MADQDAVEAGTIIMEALKKSCREYHEVFCMGVLLFTCVMREPPVVRLFASMATRSV